MTFCLKEEEKKQSIMEDPYATVDTDCSVCLFEKMDTVLPCMHAFCSGCIKSWMEKEQACPICRQSILTEKIKRTNSELEQSFFELIDVDGKDNVIPELESQIEQLMNSAINFLLDMEEYQVEQNMTDNNPHIKVDLDYFDEEQSD